MDNVNFADNNTLYVCLSDLISVMAQLNDGMDKIVDKFSIHFLKVNADKCNLLSSCQFSVDRYGVVRHYVVKWRHYIMKWR